jgi:hypothetical protein
MLKWLNGFQNTFNLFIILLRWVITLAFCLIKFWQSPPIQDLDILQVIKGLGFPQLLYCMVHMGLLLTVAPQYSHHCLNLLLILVASHRNTFHRSMKRRLSIWQRGNSYSVSNYRHISLLNNFSKVFEFVIGDNMVFQNPIYNNKFGNIPWIHFSSN